MIGRAAQGRPWIFREIEHFLKPARTCPARFRNPPGHADHLADLYAFYGEDTGVKVARKHISWYTKGLVGSAQFRCTMNTLPTVQEQIAAIDEFFGWPPTETAAWFYTEEEFPKPSQHEQHQQ